MAYQIKTSPDYIKNSEKTGANADGGMPCIVCGRRCSFDNAKHWVRIFGGLTAVTRAEADKLIAEGHGNADMNYYPVGAVCLRDQPELKEYVKDAKENGGI